MFVTFIPNHLLGTWWFVLFVFADFFYAAHWVKRKFKGNLFLNTLLVGLIG
jgi:hypothetical protein